ncbi:CPBP family glutamic-type intramembrane protease [Nocardiopsis ganjiahuensis]|uniref:CPBP family glutamic-type intramembrane protease n=1 Tax=Nocardiopsis ganjiahuensis TaxID=239984 RepID=UPI000347E427|nr:CPBP family glutamic-type intramembrane protease [Nocardiopsis ganjiahuensis]
MSQPEPTRLRGHLARAGLLVLAFTLVTAAAQALARALGADPSQPLGLAVQSAAFLLVLLPLARLLCRTGGATLPELGPATCGRPWTLLIAGALTCGVATALIVAGALLTGNASLGSAAPVPAALLLLPLVLTAQILPEELVFRGYVQHLLGSHLSQLSTVLVQALLFAGAVSLVLGHAGALFDLALAGVFFGVLRMTTGGIWAGLGTRTALTGTALVLSHADFTFTTSAPLWNLGMNMGAGLAVYLVIRFLVVARPGLVRTPAEGNALPRRRIPVRGIMYDLGTSYVPGQHSRERWNPDAVREEMRVIHEDLHCTAVSLFGPDLDRMGQAARFALDQGLDVWLQPRSLDAGHTELVEHVGRAAELAEELAADRPGRIVLNVGCELTVLNRGILPGRNMDRRARALSVFGAFPSYYNRRLNTLLRRLAATARERFSGPLTYGSGTWESVDWTPFDLVGVDYYLDELTQGSYRQGLRSLSRRWGKPVVVTEFGCCSYQGAQTKGGSGADPLDWRDLDDRRVRGGLVRDESVQADTIERLIDVYETEDVHGAFLCMFVEGDCRPSADPARDCDMAGFGIVRPPTLESGLSPDDGHWEPKEGFHALARRYGADVEAAPNGSGQG